MKTIIIASALIALAGTAATAQQTTPPGAAPTMSPAPAMPPSAPSSDPAATSPTGLQADGTPSAATTVDGTSGSPTDTATAPDGESKHKKHKRGK